MFFFGKEKGHASPTEDTKKVTKMNDSRQKWQNYRSWRGTWTFFGKEKGHVSPWWTNDTKKMVTKRSEVKMTSSNDVNTAKKKAMLPWLKIRKNGNKDKRSEAKMAKLPQLKGYVIIFWKRKRPRFNNLWVGPETRERDC